MLDRHTLTITKRHIDTHSPYALSFHLAFVPQSKRELDEEEADTGLEMENEFDGDMFDVPDPKPDEKDDDGEDGEEVGETLNPDLPSHGFCGSRLILSC